MLELVRSIYELFFDDFNDISPCISTLSSSISFSSNTISARVEARAASCRMIFPVSRASVVCSADIF